jgi:hypothetical protein
MYQMHLVDAIAREEQLAKGPYSVVARKTWALELLGSQLLECLWEAGIGVMERDCAGNISVMMWEGSFSGGGARGLRAVAHQWWRRCVLAGRWCRAAPAFCVRMAADPMTELYFTIIL